MMAGRYSLLDQSGLQKFLPIAQAKNIAVIAAVGETLRVVRVSRR
jgi:hypothetical protein